jgi:nucleoside-diphosphate kinase
MERTLSIVKPDAVAKGATGAIIEMLQQGGLRPVAIKMMQLSDAQARGFYAVHRERGFFADLCKFMSSGPVVVMVLEGPGAVAKNREIMGPTDSKKAPPGTIRQRFGTDIERNAVHGSDAVDTAKTEIGFFFSGAELASLGLA